MTWDADAAPNARDFFINQATPEGIANTLTDEAARLLGAKGEFAIVTGALSAANQNLWIDFIKKRLAKYPEMKLVTIRPGMFAANCPVVVRAADPRRRRCRALALSGCSYSSDRRA